MTIAKEPMETVTNRYANNTKESDARQRRSAIIEKASKMIAASLKQTNLALCVKTATVVGATPLADTNFQANSIKSES